MKIAYDGKRAMRNYTGLGNYSRLILETMSEAYPADDHWCMCRKFAPIPA